MAIYHMSGSIVGRSHGRSAVACAAYRAGDKLLDERTQQVHDYTKKQDVAYCDILLPENAPAWMANREQLWNAVEKIEVRKDAQLAREFTISLPRELTLEQNIALAKEFAQHEFVDKGMVADVCIHNDKAPDGERQPHAHVLLTMREVTQDGFGQKVREWNAKEHVIAWREAWANAVNRELALHGHDVRVDHRTLEAQGIDLEPQYKIGTSQATERMARFEDHQRIAFENGQRILENPSIALDAITHQQSTFTHQDVARFVNRHTVDASQFEQVFEGVKQCPELVHLGQDDKGRERFTTQSMLAVEVNLLEAVKELGQRLDHGVHEDRSTEALRTASLRDEQLEAYDYLINEGDMKCVVGYAGTGKSYLLSAANVAWELEGFRVRGLTLSGIAAQNLTASSGIESRTLASQQYYWDKGEQRLTQNDILVVDEAGMLGSRQLERVLSEATVRGAKVVLVGDPEQLQAIEAGGAFRAIVERMSQHGGVVELTDIQRQTQFWQQCATKDLATGRTTDALKAYQEKDHVHEFVTQAEAKQGLVNHWNDVRLNESDKTHLMLSYTRNDVQELNGMARQLRHQEGELGQDVNLTTARGERTFAVNDRVYFLKNDRGLGVMNGSLGTIEKIEGEQVTIRLDNHKATTSMHDHPLTQHQSVRVDLNHYNHLDHGYAATVHKAQGVTVDRSMVLASTYFDRHTSYVALSRHRDSVDVFWSKEAFGNFRNLCQDLSEARPKDMAVDYYASNRGFERPFDDKPSLQSTSQAAYQDFKAGYQSSASRQESALARLQERKELKALDGMKADVEKRYGQSPTMGIEKGEKAYYHETITQGDKKYALLEYPSGLNLVPLEKGQPIYKGSWVKTDAWQDNLFQQEKVSFKKAKAHEIDFTSSPIQKGREKELDMDIDF